MTETRPETSSEDPPVEPEAIALVDELRSIMRALSATLEDSRGRLADVTRQLSNPNLSDIPLDLPYRIEQWDRRNVRISWTICASSSLYVAHGAFQAAVDSYPTEHWTLRNRAQVIRKHPSDWQD